MANQIAANVPAHAAPELAVAHHIVQFWTPTMKERLINEADRSELSPIVQQAIDLELNPLPPENFEFSRHQQA
ncbi:MAG TPA: formate dehydrogenase subunit delta [Candidatus Paceibacterota bacterium]|nr:formate dehydrogenase subunit delta [Candidatus Paceibacterota bacterium]